jgi:hypothetical protein
MVLAVFPLCPARATACGRGRSEATGAGLPWARTATGGRRGPRRTRVVWDAAPRGEHGRRRRGSYPRPGRGKRGRSGV